VADPAVVRWPAFAQAGVDAGVLAVFAFPLAIGAIRIGVLVLYRDRPGTFVELADTMVKDFDVVECLHRLAERCVELLDCTEAGLLLADAAGVLRVMASSSERSDTLDLLQSQNEEGPCFECYCRGVPVFSEDLTAGAGRWPTFAPMAVQMGFRSVQAIPMRVRGACDQVGRPQWLPDPAPALYRRRAARRRPSRRDSPRRRTDRGEPLMSILAKQRGISTLAAADDAALFAAVASLSVEAVEETYERHATASVASRCSSMTHRRGSIS
jgi:hypothetical protein